MDLYLQNLGSLEGIVNLAEFAGSTWVAATVSADYKMCLGVGIDLEDINLEVKATLKLWNCAMTILDDLLDFSKTWTGRDAKYLDSCGQSDTRTVTFYDNAIIDSSTETYNFVKRTLWGTRDPESVNYCVAVPRLYGSSGGDDLASLAYKNVFGYFTGDHDFFTQ